MKGACQEVTVSMFIISDSGEMLLHQQQDCSFSSPVWGIPYFIYNDHSPSMNDAAQHCLMQLGLQGELHELFGREHVMIALVEADTVITRALPAEYVWHSMHHIIHDTRERPTHYSSLLKCSLEGVLLYMKTYLTDHISLKFFTHTEF
jgi:hypothetical protein